MRILAALVLAAVVQAPLPSGACSHLWRFSELYSSPDRSIQFIEMQEVGGSSNEWRIGNHWYRTNSYNLTQTDLLGSNLPNVSTANKKFLVGSESYAALPGVPAPDYTIPDGAINPAGDTVIWWFYQTITIPPQTMPSDGVQSLHVTNPSQSNPPPIYVTGPNSPTNFAGQTGTVVLSTAVPVATPQALALVAFGVVALGLLVLARRQRA